MLILFINSATKTNVADFGKNMYSDFTKYEAPKTTTSTPLNDEEEIEWLVRQYVGTSTL